jgi:hypothetical protein
MIKTMLTVCIAGCCLLTTMATGWDFTTAHKGTAGPFTFDPLPTPAPCVVEGAGAFPNEQPFVVPTGYGQTDIAREGDGGAPDNWDLLTRTDSNRNSKGSEAKGSSSVGRLRSPAAAELLDLRTP